tara:strand:- start:32 stop:472 length:441 start_codon:yes stop_codon:yes gene_type:complete
MSGFCRYNVPMARCDEGYLCEVCGSPVDEIHESDLYLSFVIGELPASALTIEPERHVRCNPVQAQFIIDERFEPMSIEGPFDKRQLDSEDVTRREDLVTRGWQRLQEVAVEGLAIDDYRLEDVVPDVDTGLPPEVAGQGCVRPETD